MKVSTKGRYGIRLMLYLAVNYQNGHISLKEIAKNQDISEKYLEQIINPLTKSGLVHSIRGAQGGYALALEPQNISVGSILRVLEGSLSPVDCVEAGGTCSRASTCTAFSLWKRMKDAIDEIVDNTTLADLVEEYNENNCEYYI